MFDLSFVVIGLVCNSLGCYWAPLDEKYDYPFQQDCIHAAADLKVKSAMYFDTACIVVAHKKPTN
jgi:hypothetical protein